MIWEVSTHYLLNRKWESKANKDDYGVVKIKNDDKLYFLTKSYVAELIWKIKHDYIIKNDIYYLKN